jgi:hypothetical protein
MANNIVGITVGHQSILKKSVYLRNLRIKPLEPVVRESPLTSHFSPITVAALRSFAAIHSADI